MKQFQYNLRILFVVATILSLPQMLRGQGTAFSYQGRLQVDGAPANGSYDLTFTLFTGDTGGTPVAGPITNSAVAVSNGLFTVVLDFGASVWNGATNWLEMAVQTNGAGSFTTVAPRQQMTPTPYAIFAENLGSGGLGAGTYSNAVSFNNPSNQFSGAFTGDGTGLTNVNAATLGGLSPDAFWQISGNAGTTAGANFLGTIDNQPLELKAGGQRALRLEPNTAALAPNVIGGSAANLVDSGITGATIAGGGSTNFPNHVGAIYATISGGRNNFVGADHAAIGGGHDNNIGPFAYDSVIAGGASDTIQSNALESVIGGGDFNTVQAGASLAFIGGGYGNTLSTNASYAAIGGGFFNLSQGSGSFIGGGYFNLVATNTTAVIGGGSGNQIQGGADYATVSGGYGNVVAAGAQQGVIGGGAQNVIQNGATNGVIGGGGLNLIQANSRFCAILGGQTNAMGPSSWFDFIGGGYANSIVGNYDYAVIGGGAFNSIGTGGSDSTIGGGFDNSIGDVTVDCTIAGGGYNTIQSGTTFLSESDTISGGDNNSIGTSNECATISGGRVNTIGMNCSFSTISGGFENIISPGSRDAVIGGGQQNAIQTNSITGTIGGGYFNVIQTNAPNATISGGANNTIQANAHDSTIGGGFQNTILANAAYATIPGGYLDFAAGQYSFAAGRQAHALHDGAFVWADSQAADFDSVIPNQFLIRAGSGAGIGTSDTPPGGLRVHSGGLAVTGQSSPNYGAAEGVFLEGSPTSGLVYAFDYSAFQPMPLLLNSPGGNVGIGNASPGNLLVVGTGGAYCNGTTWVNGSDRNSKEHFAPVDPGEVLSRVLALPVQRWNYKAQPAQQHLGPMAQDFYAAFGLGENERSIATVDADGVALAAIQGLNKKLEARTRQLEGENADLKERLQKLEQFVCSQKAATNMKTVRAGTGERMVARTSAQAN